MPLALLRRIVRECPPLMLIGDEDIEAARILVLAGHVKTVIQAVSDPETGRLRPKMIVTEVTPLGRRMLQAFPGGEIEH